MKHIQSFTVLSILIQIIAMITKRAFVLLIHLNLKMHFEISLLSFFISVFVCFIVYMIHLCSVSCFFVFTDRYGPSKMFGNCFCFL